MQKKLIAELIGTFILVFAGTGAIIINDIANAIGHVGIALTFGFVIVALIYSFATCLGRSLQSSSDNCFLVNG